MSTADSSDLDVLAAWAPELADTLVMLSCDIALVLDDQGRIATLAQVPGNPIADDTWVGRLWVQTAGADSRSKLENLLADVAAKGSAQRREINHPGVAGSSVPVAYSAVRLGQQGPILAVGRDLRSQAAMQQRFVAAQEALERAYWDAQKPNTQQTSEPVQGKAKQGATLTIGERQSLGLSSAGGGAVPNTQEQALVGALASLVDRIGNEELTTLLKDARELAERYFLNRTLESMGAKPVATRSTESPRRPVQRRKANKRSI